MKQVFLVLAIGLVPALASGQTDSLSTEQRHELGEVTVVSDVARTSTEKSVFMPTRKQRNAATDAVALLRHMMIPQLSIDPESEEVRTIAGEEVGIFIDFRPAAAEDLAGMNTQDVKRVEIYDHPADVRFQNRAHVVNFVMQRYEVGGYTKLSAAGQLMSGRDFNTTNSVYSKLVSRQWTFDANVADLFAQYAHGGVRSEAVFRLPGQTVARTELAENGRSRIHRPSASLRATCQTDNVQLANRLELLYEDRPRNELAGTVGYSPGLASATAESRRSARSLSPRFSGDWFFELPGEWALAVCPEFRYSRNEQSRFYRETATIENEIKEDVASLDWMLDLSKTFSGRHTFSLTNYGLYYSSHLEYKGSTAASHDIRNLVFSQGANYRYNTERLSVSAGFSYDYQRNKVGGESEELWFPSFGLNCQYSPSRKSSLSLDFNSLRSGPTDPQQNPSLMQESELMYYCGNPALKYYSHYAGRVQYNWMPTSKFTASAYVQHVYVHNYIADVYDLHNNGTAVIRRIENAGDSHATNISASLTLRLLDGNLLLSAKPTLTVLRVSGVYDEKATPFALNLSANYYLGQLYLMAGYTTPKKSYDSDKASWQHARSSCYLTAGWGSARWKVRLDIVNPLRNDWRNKRTETDSPLYSAETQLFNASCHRRLTLTLARTFSYGKKVKPGNELNAAASGQSSIL